MALLACRLCGVTHGTISQRLILLKSGKYTTGPRCRDEGGCMDRVAAAGREWMLARHSR